jgi:hypothetical protein
MKRISLIALSLILLGAGCLGSSSSTGNDGGIYQTANSGEDWVQTVLVPTAAGIGTLATTDVLNMEMDPQDSSYLYVGTRQNGMLYSEDNGSSWRQPEYGPLSDGLIYSVDVDPSDVCTVYVAKGSRLYRTSDCMRSFDDEMYVENRSGVSVVQVLVDWYNSKIIWIGLTNGDVLKSTDSGKTWKTVLKTDEEISDILISNSDSRQVIVSKFDNGMHKTIDGGATWEELDGGLSDLRHSGDVFSLIQSDDSRVVLASTAYGIVRSRDFGNTWEPIDLVTSAGQVKIRSLAMDGGNPDVLYYAANATFYRSLDGGETWNTERLPTNRVVRSMLLDPNDNSRIYIGVATQID